MVKKVKRFVVFVLFSFFYSLLSSKVSEAARLYLVPQTEGGKLKYNGQPADVNVATVADEICY